MVVAVSRSGLNDSGVYVCTAVNTVGVASFGVNVQVNELKGISTLFLYITNLLTSLALPVFIVSPQSVSVSTGQDIILHCQATGPPLPVVQWVRLSSNQVIPTNGTLFIANSSLSDAGDYLCVASNDVGVSSIRVTIAVRDPTGIVVLIEMCL